jgi:hypothetical protein
MPVRRVVALPCILAACLVHSAAWGEPDWGAPEPPSDRTGSIGHERKGFFLRFGVGGGYMLGSQDIAIEQFTAGQSWTANEPATQRGVALLSEISIGGTIAPGLVLGGGLYDTTVPATTAKAFGLEESIGVVSASLVCPMVDGFLSPRQGFHVGGGPCFAVAQIGDGKDPIVGWGLTGAIGYDFWVGGAWSLGVLGRAHYVNASSGSSPTFQAVTPGLLFAATYY